MNILPAKHRHAAREQAIHQGLHSAWNSIAPDLDSISDRDAANALLDSFEHVEMYGGMKPEDLAAWRDLLLGNREDRRLAMKLVKGVI